MKGIFGTPSEPLFNLPTTSLSPGLLAEWLQVLANENNQNMKQASPDSGYFLSGIAVQFVFQLAVYLDLPVPAKYLAAELFERFMVIHIRDLHKHAKGLKNNRLKEWKIILDRVRSQLPLRALSCCQVASKLTSHYKIVSTGTVRKVLSSLGHNYSSDSILQSEIRVLKTVNYHVMTTSPLIYLETLLEIMGYNNKDMDVKIFHKPCLHLLDFVYLRLTQVYDCLYHVATGRQPTSAKDRKKIVSVKRDYMLQATAIIAASSYIVDQEHTDKVIDSLSQITKIPSDDILDLAAIIIQQVTEDTEMVIE
ncbi:hypothetical protein LSH36_152g04050 [Paralvinella palmiformis]|uniref:Cyclin N-terminal domain-containing protein n=1 Tax=Paralvinella palmiformis TaxID=53620 RepID=A0AAD9JUZ0_9ANNE|nr:hypothetical protein LSH36_152g04050 [Paralvinella palmiformis]